MSRFSVASLARTGWEVLTSPRRFRATLDTEEGIARAVLFFFACAVAASALDLVGIAVLRTPPHALGALPMAVLRLVFLTGLVPFIGGGILYGVCWIAGSKAIIETGLHVASYAVGAVLPIAAVLRYLPTRGLHAAVTALGYGLVLVIVGASLAWRGRRESSAPSRSPLAPAERAPASAARPQPSP
jgi:hypothetical protein